MRTAEERFMALEVESAEHRVTIHSLEQSIGEFRAEVSRRFDAVEDRLEGRFEVLGGKIDALGKEMSVQFRWTIGLLFSALVAVVLALVRG